MGDQTERLPCEQLRPQLLRQVGGGHHEATSDAAMRQPCDERIDVGDRDIEQSRGAEWHVGDRTRQQRPNAPTTRRDRDRVGRVPIGKVVGRDDPGDVDLGASTQAGCDAQGDPVHGLSLRA